MSRYDDAYIVSQSLVGFGSLVKIAGYVVGGATILLGFVAGAQAVSSSAVVLVLVGIISGVALGLPIYILGVLVSAQGQILKASLDTAVHASQIELNTRPQAERSSATEPRQRTAEPLPAASASGRFLVCPSCGKQNPQGSSECQWCHQRYAVES